MAESNRPMNFTCDYAKRGTASCKKCRDTCEKGQLRIAKLVPNYFSGEGEMKQWHHPKCLFEMFERARPSTKIIESLDDIAGCADLTSEDREVINDLIKDVSERRAGKVLKAVGKKSVKRKSKSDRPNSGSFAKTVRGSPPVLASTSNASEAFGIQTGTERFTFFYRSKSPFSQWHPCAFSADGVDFNCAEQYMMYRKAVLFGDMKIAEQILSSSNPRKHKSLGRQVKNFDPVIWKAQGRKIVADGSYLKFTQNAALQRKLLETAGTTLVEASPSDKIWGIGLAETNPLALNRRTWKGTNYLGEALTQVRERIIRESAGK